MMNYTVFHGIALRVNLVTHYRKQRYCVKYERSDAIAVDKILLMNSQSLKIALVHEGTL